MRTWKHRHGGNKTNLPQYNNGTVARMNKSVLGKNACKLRYTCPYSFNLYISGYKDWSILFRVVVVNHTF